MLENFMKGRFLSPNETSGGNQEKIIDTVEIIPFGEGRENAQKVIEIWLSELPENSSIKDAAIILVEMYGKTKEAGSGTFLGISEAEKFLVKHPNKKILLCSMMPLNLIRENKPEIDRLLLKNNIRYTDLLDIYPGEDVNKIGNIFNESIGNVDEVDNKEIIEISKRNISQKVSTVLHRFENYGDPYNPDEKNRSKVTEGLDIAREEFPSMKEKSDKELLDFLFETRKNLEREEVMKGEEIHGVFCDIEGTLIVNGEINKEILEKLNLYEKEGKMITLWTDGDKDELQKILDGNNIKYPLQSKFDYAGAVAEIVIDDSDENTFNARTKIYAKEFIQV